MRMMLWTLLVAPLAAQTENIVTVSVCNSYSYMNTITYVEYSTIFADADNTRSMTPSAPATVSFTTAIVGMSNSGLLTSRTTTTNTGTIWSRTTTRTGTDDVPGNGTSILIPGQDTIAPPTPIPTDSTSTSPSAANSVSSTIASTAPDATNGQFYVIFNIPDKRRLRKRSVEYLAFDDAGESILVVAEADAVGFVLDSDGSLMTTSDGQQYVAIEDSAPPRFFLQPTKPDPPVAVSISSNGTVSVQGIEGYCASQDGDLVISSDGRFPSGCGSVMPELIRIAERSSSTTTMATTNQSTVGSSSSSSTSTTTDSGTVSTAIDVPSSSTESASSTVSTSTSTSTSFKTTTASYTISQTQTPSKSSFMLTTESSSTDSGSTPTTMSSSPIVTDQAYIDTVMRHHNYHRLNHSAPSLSWSDNLASSAKDIADNCIYAHNTSADGGGYGQNIGAGYLPVQMGALISDGFYNGEVNSYTYYGNEPNYTTLHSWGHFSQIVWVDTTQVGCYTTNCTASGLGNVDPSTGIRPFFTVCNYGPPGNYVGEFAQNVLSPAGLSTIHAGYECPNDQNCVDNSL